MYSKLTFSLAFLFIIDFTACAQFEWISKSSVPRYGRHEAVSFVINGKGYFGLGRKFDGNNLNDFWEYDPSTDTWTKKNNFPGGALFSATSFVVGGKGYVCLGFNGSTSLNTLWEYNPTNDSWTKKANFPGSARYGAGSFVIGNAAFVGAGSASGAYQNDFYMYVPSSNTWVQRASFPGSKSINITGFAVNNEGYFGNGKSGSNTLTNKFWKYDVSKNSWSAVASLPGTYRRITSAFVVNDTAYVGCGTNSGTSINTFLNDFYAYDYVKNKWIRKTSNSNFTPRISAHHFVFGDTSVYTVGGYGVNGSLAGLWKLGTSQDTCDYFDTTAVTEHDTVYHHEYDTTFTTIYDTVVYQRYDTTFVTIYDTIAIRVYDTTYRVIYDTSNITIVDTTYVNIYDTTRINHYDTIVRTIYRRVDDTLVVRLYHQGCGDVSVLIYPNPSSDIVYVFSSNEQCLRGNKIELYDDIGRLVRTQVISNYRTAIDVKGLAPAIYGLRVLDNSGNILMSKKILIL